MALTKGDAPEPPETDEPAIETVTGASKPSASGEMAKIPEFTEADSGIKMVTVSGLVPSRLNEELLEKESCSVILDCQPRWP